MNKLIRVNHQRWCRAGISSVEYVAVTTLICVFTCSAIFVLRSNSNPFMEVADRVAVSTNNGVTKQPAEESPIEGLAIHDNLFGFQVFTVASSLCIVAFGFFYIKQGRSLRRNQDQNIREVKFLQKQSIALRKIIDKRNHIHKMVRDGWAQIGSGTGTVESVMSRDVATLFHSMTVKEAMEFLDSNGYRRSMVVDNNNRLVGIVSRKDLRSDETGMVGDVMTRNPKTATPDMDLRIAISILLQRRISCLPVVKDEQLVGLVSTSDLMIVLQCMLVSLKEDCGNNLTHNFVASGMRKKTKGMCGSPQ